MGNGGFTVSRLNRKVFQRAGRNQTAQTRVLMLSPSLLLNSLDTQSRKAKLLLPATPIGIVEYALTLLWEILCPNSCLSSGRLREMKKELF